MLESPASGSLEILSPNVGWKNVVKAKDANARTMTRVEIRMIALEPWRDDDDARTRCGKTGVEGVESGSLKSPSSSSFHEACGFAAQPSDIVRAGILDFSVTLSSSLMAEATAPLCSVLQHVSKIERRALANVQRVPKDEDGRCRMTGDRVVVDGSRGSGTECERFKEAR